MIQPQLPISVWVLNIIEDIDDRKRYGETPESKIFLTTTRENVFARLVNRLHEQMGDLYGADVESINKQLLPYLQINEEEYDDAYEIKEEYRENENVLSFIHSIIAKGEYIAFKWSYKLYQQTIKN